MSWLQPRNGGLHFILNDNGNYDFDVKVERCGFVGFVNDVINLCVQFIIDAFYDELISNKAL